MSKVPGFVLPGNSKITLPAGPASGELVSFPTTALREYVSPVLREITDPTDAERIVIDRLRREALAPDSPTLYVSTYGTDWYRQPGTKERPLRSMHAATKRLAISGWRVTATVLLMGTPPRHRRRTVRARRKENAARRRRS